MGETTFRRTEPDEEPVLYELFRATLADLAARIGVETDDTAGDPYAWERRRPLFEHLGRTADESWIALDADRRPVGYARSILRDGDRELTEFFVLPVAQSRGIGRELLGRAFPEVRARHRTIIATGDPRALARYLKTGLAARFPIVAFVGAPGTADAVPTDLVLAPVAPTRTVLAELARIDRRVIGHRRDVDHSWLIAERRGVVARRAGRAVGYGYAGRWMGPIAALEPEDQGPLLAWAAAVGAELGEREIGFEVPGINRVATQHLLARGFRLDPFVTYFLSDNSAGRFDRYVVTSPPFFV